MYIPSPATYSNAIHIQNEVIAIVKKHLSDGHAAIREVVQLIYMDCPRILQIY